VYSGENAQQKEHVAHTGGSQAGMVPDSVDYFIGICNNDSGKNKLRKLLEVYKKTVLQSSRFPILEEILARNQQQESKSYGCMP